MRARSGWWIRCQTYRQINIDSMQQPDRHAARLPATTAHTVHSNHLEEKENKFHVKSISTCRTSCGR